jgi:Ca2+-binding RTX toxin-like protein
MVTSLYNGIPYEIYEGTIGDDSYEHNNALPLKAHGYSGADNIKGSNYQESPYGLVLGDFLFGDDGEDRLTGGDGSDFLDGGWDNDILLGGANRDTLEGWQGNDKLDGGEDNDTLYGYSGNDDLLGGSGNDLLVGGEGADILNAHDPNGKGEIDELLGGAGSDTFILGEKGKVFYLDDPNNPNAKSYAVIGRDRDLFEPGIDKIQLAGAVNNYTFALDAGFGSATTDIKITENSSPNDPIAFVVDVPLANLNIANDVIFV